MATKKFIGYTTTAKTVYGIIERQVDSYRLNDADGTFAAAPADPYVSFTEHSVIKGEYVLSESRTVWNDGMYKCTVYEQSGGSPVPASDLAVAYQYMYVYSDAEVEAIFGDVVEGTSKFIELLRIITAVLAGKSTGGGTATLTFRDIADAKARVTATVDASGNRTAITRDGT